MAALPMLLFALASTLATASNAQEHTASDTARATTHVVFHASPAIDLYFLARKASAPGAVNPLPALAPALEAARALERSLGGSMLALAPLDGLLPGCQSVADLAAAFARAPQELTLRGGGKAELRGDVRAELREGALALAAALAEAETAHRELWKERSARIEAARRRWEEQVGPKERELFAFHLTSLGMQDPGLALPVFLVCDAPWPGAVTVRGEEGRGVSFVAVDGLAGSQLFEIVLHEVTHSLDLAAGEASAFAALGAQLEAAGLDGRDRRLRDLPHTLMFVQSAESIRRVIDPAHRDYGEVEKVYERTGRDAETVRGLWRDFLDQKLTREEAVAAIVESLAPVPK